MRERIILPQGVTASVAGMETVRDFLPFRTQCAWEMLSPRATTFSPSYCLPVLLVSFCLLIVYRAERGDASVE
jgi:hypothetical protein